MPRLATRLACIGVLAVTSPAWCGIDSKLQVELFQGHDSNPLEISDEPEAGGSAAYTDLALRGMLAWQWSPRAGAFARADASSRFHASGLSDADRTRAELEMGVAFVPYRRGDRRFSFLLGGRYGASRQTFIDPASGEVYALAVDPNTTVPVPDRFDFDTVGAFVNLRFRAHHRVLLMLDADLETRRFVESYPRIPGLDSLDDRSLALQPGVRLDLADGVGLDLSAEWSDRRFDELDALDETAQSVPGTTRRYRSTSGRFALRLERWQRWKIATGLRRTDRSDTYAGYYDSMGTAGFAATEFAATEKLRFGLDLSRRLTEYEHATIDSDPAAPRRRGAVARAAGRAERDLSEHLTLILEAGRDRAADRDPVYRYERGWIQAGARFRL